MDARTPGRRAAHAAKMRRLIERFTSSGFTQAEFCRKHGLALSTFAYWQRRCRTAEVPPFVEVTIAEPRQKPATVVALEPRPLVGVDWVTQPHQVCVIESFRSILDERSVSATCVGLFGVVDKLRTPLMRDEL